MHLARLFLAALAVACTWGCGGDGATVSGSSARLELGAGVTAEPVPGAVRDGDTARPSLWLSVPNATVVLRSGPEQSPEQSFSVSNVPPGAPFELRSARYRDGADRDRCDVPPRGAVDCPSSDPICSAVSARPTDGAPTSASISVDLPPCAEARVGFEWVVDRSAPLRLVVAGAAENADRLGDLLDRQADSVKFALLTGDSLNSADSDGLGGLADALAGRDLPVVVAPGEEELSAGSMREFEGRFGTTTPNWTVGGIQFVGFPTPKQSAGSNGVNELDSRLADLDRERPIAVLTHTPPFDPADLRDRGFRSRIEAGRVVSTLATHRADLLFAGHLPDRHQREYGDVDLIVAPPPGGEDLLTVDLRTPAAGAEAKLEASVVDTTP